MKYKFSISIEGALYDLILKDEPNKSRYLENLLRKQYAEDHKVSISKSVARQLYIDDDFNRMVKNLCHDYMEERRNGDWS